MLQPSVLVDSSLNQTYPPMSFVIRREDKIRSVGKNKTVTEYKNIVYRAYSDPGSNQAPHYYEKQEAVLEFDGDFSEHMDKRLQDFLGPNDVLLLQECMQKSDTKTIFVTTPCIPGDGKIVYKIGGYWAF